MTFDGEWTEEHAPRVADAGGGSKR